MWTERWFLSCNAKDIGTLYLIFALFSGFTIKPESYHAICLEDLLTLLYLEYKHNILFILWRTNNNFKDLLADNHIIYGNLRDFTHELSLIIFCKLNSFIILITMSFVLLFICSNYFPYLFTSCFQSFTDNNLQLNQWIFASYSTNNIIQRMFSFSFQRRWQSTNNSTKSELGAYLAGLIESDGSIIIPKDSTTRPTIKIVFNIKDRPLAERLMEIIGSGSIQPASENAVEYVVRAKLGIVKIVNLINGELRTPKIKALHKIIDWINANPNYNSSSIIQKMSLNTTPLSSNSWFSGFSEGDGSFYIRITEGVKYNNISTIYTISQGNKDDSVLQSYKPIMLLIAELCVQKIGETGLLAEKNGLDSFMWRVRTTNKKGVSAIVQYFNRFPLWSSKHLDFINWEQAHYIIMTKTHTKPRGLSKIKQLKNSMNNKRTKFSWKHLENFYK